MERVGWYGWKRGLFAHADVEQRRVWRIRFHAIWTITNARWNVPCRRVLSHFAKWILSHISLRGHFTRLFAHITLPACWRCFALGAQEWGIQCCHESSLLAFVTTILSFLSPVLARFAILLPGLAELLARVTGLRRSRRDEDVTKLLSRLAGL